MADDDKRYLIWSFEHQAWWRAGGVGYTRQLDDAGLFSEARASKICRDANIVRVQEAMVPATMPSRGSPNYWPDLPMHVSPENRDGT